MINGLTIGMVYGLIAVGLSLIFGVMKIVNFAHGEFYMLGAYTFYYLGTLFGIPMPISVIITFLVLAAIGSATERILLSPLEKPGFFERREEYPIIITFALSILLQNFAVIVFSPWTKSPPSIIGGVTTLGTISIGTDRVFAGGVSIIVLILLYFIVNKTKIGMALRATSQDRDAASLFGVNIRFIYIFSWAVASMLAGLAGILLSPVFLISPDMGASPCLKAYVILVLGGLGSIRGAFAGSLILGVVESLGSAYISDAYRDAYGFIILIMTLLFRPQGIFGERG
ncbi:MAG: branched-chain amino acid ABC transporter permease [Thermoproteota archaeon]